jgi:predicted TIM-barrel fold metal-dependent hydrolase
MTSVEDRHSAPHHTGPKLSYDNAMDADGHIIEPPDLWQTYIEPKFRDRALRVDYDADGLEVVVIDNKPHELTAPGYPSILAAMGMPDLGAVMMDPNSTMLSVAPFGSTDPAERIRLLDAEGIETAALYTTMGLCWDSAIEEPALAQAHSTAYNRWICEFCSGSDRLVAMAHLSLTDPAAAARELHRAVGEGARGGYVAPFTPDARPLGHPDNDPLFAAAQELGVPIGIHPMVEPQWTKGTRMGVWSDVKNFNLVFSVTAADGVRHQFASLFEFAVLDRFPRLKVIVLEAGGGWIGYYLDRMDAVVAHTALARGTMKKLPSEYFRENVWISCDPDERTIPALAARFGAERFVWASDFPHVDHSPEYIADLEELIGLFPEKDRRGFAGDNFRAALGIR